MTAAQLDPLTIGLVLAVLGMGGTLLTLYVLSLIMALLTRLFPLEQVPSPESGVPSPPPSPETRPKTHDAGPETS